MSLEALITKEKQKVALLEELQESKAYEACTYHVVRVGRELVLYDIATQKEVPMGCSVSKWLQRRNIPLTKVYNSKLLSNSIKTP